MAEERIYKSNEIEYKRLRIVSDRMNEIAEEKYGNRYTVFYRVSETYLDYGQNWKWSTIIKEKMNGDSCQILCPRDFKLIIHEDSISKLMEYAEKFM